MNLHECYNEGLNLCHTGIFCFRKLPSVPFNPIQALLSLTWKMAGKGHPF